MNPVRIHEGRGHSEGHSRQNYFCDTVQCFYEEKWNQCESLECDCGEIETVQHFLLECPLYEEERDQLLKNLFSQLGINYLDMDLLLGYSENENIPGWRESIINELGQYLARTGRLFSRVADEDIPQ